MAEEIKPALTPEQWKERAYDSSTVSAVAGPRIAIYAEFGHEAIAEASLKREEAHGVAALLLYGQPFGFTREDVELAQWGARAMLKVEAFGFADKENAKRFLSLADRIAALLPPKDPNG